MFCLLILRYRQTPDRNKHTINPRPTDIVHEAYMASERLLCLSFGLKFGDFKIRMKQKRLYIYMYAAKGNCPQDDTTKIRLFSVGVKRRKAFPWLQNCQIARHPCL